MTDIRQGDRIQDGHSFHTRYNVNVPVYGLFDTSYQAFSANLYLCAENQAPSRLTSSMSYTYRSGVLKFKLTHFPIDVRRFCCVEWRLFRSQFLHEPFFTNPSDNQAYRSASFDLHVVFDSALIKYEIIYKGERVAFAEAKYQEEDLEVFSQLAIQ